jgi:hypothetical protein
MRNNLTGVVTVLVLLLAMLACNAPGLAPPTPNVWMTAPGMTVPPEMEAQPTSPGSAPSATQAVPIPSGAEPFELGILKCQNNPSSRVVPGQRPIVVVWGWATDNQAKRDEFIGIASFALYVDGRAQDMANAQKILESADTVRWKLAIGALPTGTHEIRLLSNLAGSFTESSGTYAAGRQADEVCPLVVQQ